MEKPFDVISIVTWYEWGRWDSTGLLRSVKYPLCRQWCAISAAGMDKVT